MTAFVHLRVHTEFSLVDGLVKVKDLVRRSADMGMPAVAVTDHGNLFALVKFYSAAEAAGVKPLIGCDLLLAEPEAAEDDAAASRITLLAMDATGYRHLIQLVSECYTGHPDRPDAPRRMLSRDALEACAEGLLVLSGGRQGDVGRLLLAGHRAAAEQRLAWWQRHFPERYYLELTRTGRPGEEDHVHAAVALAAAQGVPVVATNEVVFTAAEDHEAHETRVCIHEGRTLDDPRRERNYSEQQYLRSPAEMAELFADIPEALENSVEIARRCNVSVRLGTYFLPEFPVPEGMDMPGFLEQASRDGLERRLDVLLDRGAPDFAARRQPYDERLAVELKVINDMGFPGYFLIVQEFINWAKDNGVPVGPGRGSGAGSLVAYALGITDLDPLAYDLLFERFLNPERVSMPDFDVDFCMDGRDRVIGHVADLYGHNAVSQIITYGTMAAKAVVRDVARVQGKPYGLADKLSKLIPFEVGMTLHKAMEQEPELANFVRDNDEVGEIMEMAYKLEGTVRNVGKHAGGVVIAPGQLTDFVPLYTEDAGTLAPEEGDSAGITLVSQFDKDDVERAGLVKFDFLGLKTLTIIDWAVKAINVGRDADQAVDIERIPLDEAAVFRSLKAAETTAVFQLESRGMKDLIRRLQPDSFEDIVALVALFRPGPLQSGMVDDFIDRKHGRQQVSYPHPDLEPVLANTYGVILYQEQVMQIAQVLAGFSLGGADLLRRAMGKKKPEEMAKQRVLFNEGALARGVDADTATHIFDLMEKFAGYGFNKSHSAAYALVSYQTAWLKTFHPAAFMAAVMSADMQHTDKIVTFVEECREMGLTVLPPDVNSGNFRFTADAEGRIVYGLGAVKGVGEGPIDAFVAAREEGGPFTDLFDFCRRVDSKRVNRRCLEALVRSGAMDSLVADQLPPPPPEAAAALLPDRARAVLLKQLPDAVQSADQAAKNAEAGIADMFGEVQEVVQAAGAESLPKVRPLAMRERLEGEREALGLYLTGHPVDACVDELRALAPTRISGLRPDSSAQGAAGLVVSVRMMRNKRGEMMAFLVLDDRSGRIEVSVFADQAERHRELLKKDMLLLVQGEVDQDDFSGGLRLRAEVIYSLAEARARFARALELDLAPEHLRADLPRQLADMLEPHRAPSCRVHLGWCRQGAQCRVAFGDDWRIDPSDELLEALRGTFGQDRVRFAYGPVSLPELKSRRRRPPPQQAAGG